MGLEGLTDAEWLAPFRAVFAPAGQPAGSAGHALSRPSLRTYNPDLGDGRGFLFAQLREAASGRLLDLATKGSGQTPWSRAGDGG